MKNKIVFSLLTIACIIPTTVMATESSEIVVENTVTLKFNTASGTACNSIVMPIETAEDARELPSPQKAGHTFVGWFKGDIEITENNIQDAFDSIEAGATTTIIAKWEAQKPTESTSSFAIEEIDDSEEYYEVTNKVDYYADGSKIIYLTKNRIIEDEEHNKYIVATDSQTTFCHQDGTQSVEAMSTFDNYDAYYRATAKNGLSIKAVDINGEPIEGVIIHVITDKEEIDLTTDKEGKASYLFKGEYESSVKSIPHGYDLQQEPEKLGYGKMYSIDYVETYTFDIYDIGEPPIIDDTEKKDEEDKNENINDNNTNNNNNTNTEDTKSEGTNKEDVTTTNPPTTTEKPNTTTEPTQNTEENKNNTSNDTPTNTTEPTNTSTPTPTPTNTPAPTNTPTPINTPTSTPTGSSNTVTGSSNNTTTINSNQTPTSVQTGDDSPIGWILGMLGFSVIGAFFSKKKTKDIED